MWILLVAVLKTSDISTIMPVYDKPLIHDTLEQCEASMKKIYNEYKILSYNYPLEVELKTNDNKQKYIIYSYKADYTKPKVTTYYHCLKAYQKEN
tara:strand:- start:43 stop:327 length:285 start_codon:yes stop_codon:yes gene_type:complete